MNTLSQKSGLPISWDQEKEMILCGKDMEPDDCRPEIRRRTDMLEVLYDKSAAGIDELYYMYRGLSLAEDSKEIAEAGLRYDITAIRPGLLGPEFVKTAGHYHPLKPETGFTWPEVYEVLSGRAHYLLQRMSSEQPDQIDAVLLISALPGDKVLIPPGFGHITINAGDDFLIMSNWVAEGFDSVYEPVRQMQGGAFYGLEDNGGIKFVPNRNYPSLPPLTVCPVMPVEQFMLNRGIQLYNVFKTNKKALRFLTSPEDYSAVFEDYLVKLNLS
ncbi:MAG TPA: glucose-6-phosphate isomerase [Firmicutes bacterium]|nr:glucose-6-phosphate isomerase [Bacillota bacterium]